MASLAIVGAGFVLAATPLDDAFAFQLFGMSFFESGEPDTTVSDPVRYEPVLDGVNGDLQEELQTASGLFQDKSKPVSGDLGLVIKAKDDRDRLIAALYDKAYFGAVVTVSLAGTNIDDLPPEPHFPRDKPVNVSIAISSGPVFKLGSVTLKGDAADRQPGEFGLVSGQAVGSTAILKAANQLVASLRAEGRPLAKLVDRSVVADHAASTIDVSITVSSGPVADVGNISVEGTKDINPEFVASWSRLQSGKRYSPDAVKKGADRLRQLGVFSSVSITDPDALDKDGTIPLKIAVSEGKQRYFGFGAQMSTIDGAGLQGYWGHRNLFGNAETLRIEGSVSRLGQTLNMGEFDYNAAILFSKPGAFGNLSRFNAKLDASILHPNNTKTATLTAAANASFDITDQDVVSGGAELSWNETEDAFGRNRYLTFSTPFNWIRDASDDKQNPTNGYRFALNVTPSYEIDRGTAFASLDQTTSVYKSFGADDAVTLAAKLAGGTIVGTPHLDDIPSTRRFYAGGGGSVRGYAYQEISPRDVKGRVTGGLSYALGSVEARIKINDTFGIVPFVDAATVSDKSIPDFSDIRFGAGVGIRYATPFGPLRLDVAVPLNRYPGGSTFGIYAGIGQAF